MSKLLDAYPGKKLPTKRVETLILQKVKPALLKDEPRLYKTKWYDYRRLHHGQATMLFAEFYRREFKYTYAKFVDEELAALAKPLQGKGAFSLRPAAMTGLWKARQAADEMGVPYNVFVHHAMNFLCQRPIWRQHGQELPQPMHLYNDEVLLAVAEEWRDLQNTRLQFADDPWFLAANYEGHPDQDSYQMFLVYQLRHRRYPALGMATMFRDGHLLEAVAEREFEKEEVTEARQRLAR